MEDILLETLCVKDWVSIQTIRSSFLSIFQSPNLQCFSCDIVDHASALISWSAFANQMALDLITFFRQIDEFEGLNGDDRFILIKYNLLSLFILRKCFHYKASDDCCSDSPNEIEANIVNFFYYVVIQLKMVFEICLLIYFVLLLK